MQSKNYKNGARLVATVFLAAALALVLSASRAVAGTADTVRESGVMVVGVRAGYLPFSDATGQGDAATYSGFDVDLARAIATVIGVEARFVVVEPNLAVPTVAEGIIQVAPGLNHRMVWERVIDFSVTYLSGGTSALVPSSSGIYTLRSLGGKAVAVVPGTDAAEVQKKIPGITVIGVDSPGAGLALLADRKAVALVGDFKDLVNLITMSEKPASLRLIREPIVPTPIAMGLPPDDSAWREIVDRALMDLWVSGRYAEIYETWFGKGATVRLPLDFTMEVWPK